MDEPLTRTSTKMCVDTHIPRRPAQTLPFPVWDMLLCLWVPVLLGHPKIDDVNDYDQTCDVISSRFDKHLGESHCSHSWCLAVR